MTQLARCVDRATKLLCGSRTTLGVLSIFLDCAHRQPPTPLRWCQFPRSCAPPCRRCLSTCRSLSSPPMPESTLCVDVKEKGMFPSATAAAGTETSSEPRKTATGAAHQPSSPMFFRNRALSLHRPAHYLEQLNACFQQQSPSAGLKKIDDDTQAATGSGMDDGSSPVSLVSGDTVPVSLPEGLNPAAILANHTYNKATAFTEEERKTFGLVGLLPSAVETIDTQARRAYHQLNRFTLPMSKHIYLSSLRDRNETLFYRLLIEHLEEIMPLIYTPTVGQACVEYGHQFRQAEGMYISRKERGHIREVLDNWKPNVLNEVAIIVVTDGSRILGLGDLGASGMGIPVGKLSLYVAAAGFHPATTLPILLDVGTDNDQLRNDEFYLGQRHPRLPNSEFYPLVDEFMAAVKDKWPKALVQFEDFSNNHCFELLNKYRNQYLCFNDDIQGTGAVVAAGFLNALKVTQRAPTECRVVFNGAGAAGVGVANQIMRALMARYPELTEQMCRDLFYMVDSKGLITTTRGDYATLPDFKRPYARRDVATTTATADAASSFAILENVIKHVKPAALIGLSGQPGCFTPEILRFMAATQTRPIIFPLSNPTAKAECTFQQAFDATNGSVVFASGSPFPPITARTKDGKEVISQPSQGNNLYTFPGLGFGAWLSEATCVTDEMLTAATLALADAATEEDLKAGRLYPPLSNVRDCSAYIAAKVMECGFKQGVAQLKKQPDNCLAFVKENRYYPEYLSLFP